MVGFNSEKYVTFLSKIYILILKLQDLYDNFLAEKVRTIRVSSYPTCDPGGRLQNERIHRFVSLTERATYTFLPGLPRYERQSRCVCSYYLESVAKLFIFTIISY